MWFSLINLWILSFKQIEDVVVTHGSCEALKNRFLNIFLYMLSNVSCQLQSNQINQRERNKIPIMYLYNWEFQKRLYSLATKMDLYLELISTLGSTSLFCIRKKYMYYSEVDSVKFALIIFIVGDEWILEFKFVLRFFALFLLNCDQVTSHPCWTYIYYWLEGSVWSCPLQILSWRHQIIRIYCRCYLAHYIKTTVCIIYQSRYRYKVQTVV